MSVVTYNGITLPYSQITQLSQNTLMDDSGTDWYCTEFDITTQTVINSSYLSIITTETLGVPGTPLVAADIMSVIRSKLLTPKKLLSIKFNGVELIPRLQMNEGTVDSQNGPFPQSCSIFQLTDATFLMTYRIKAAYWEKIITADSLNNISRNTPGSPVLYNRWTETVDIDGNSFSKRVREGKFIIRSDNAERLIADQLRTQFAIVGVPEGFLRTSSHYTVSANGLGISYRIEDQEQFKMPPRPAFKARGTYCASTPVRGGAQRYLQVDLHLEGSKTTSQADLVSRCVAVCASKILLTGGSLRPTTDTKEFGVLDSAAVKVDMYKNEVDCMIRSFVGPKFEVIGGRTLIPRNMVWTPFSTGAENYQPRYKARGTAGILLQAAAYYDPSLSLSSTSLDATTGQSHSGLEVGTAGGVE